MNITALKSGYYTRTIKEPKKSFKSTKTLSKNGQYYKVIGTVLFIITGLCIAVFYLIPTVPL